MATHRTCDRCKALLSEDDRRVIRCGDWYQVNARLSEPESGEQRFDLCPTCLDVIVEALGGKVEKKEAAL